MFISATYQRRSPLGVTITMNQLPSANSHHPPTDIPMAHNFEQFQRLSAYFDGEATPAECREIQHLLDTDPEVKRQYQQLRQLRQALQLLPIPTSLSAQYLGQRVLAKLRQSRLKTISLWGSGAITALLVAGVLNQAPQWERNIAPVANDDAQAPMSPATSLGEPQSPGEEEALVVALNRPVLQIPKLADSSEQP